MYTRLLILTLAVFLASIVVSSVSEETPEIADHVKQSELSTTSQIGRAARASGPSVGCCTCKKPDCNCCNNTCNCARKEHPLTVLSTGTYYISDFATTWLEALQYCNKLDMDLVTFETNHEMNVVWCQIAEEEDPFPYHWTGLHEFNRPCDYRWISNNGLLDPGVQWSSGEPDDANYTRLCVDLSSDTGKLGFWYCDETVEDHFICEARC